MKITAQGAQLPEIINLAVTKAGLTHDEVHPLVAVPQAGVGKYLIALSGGHTIDATLIPGGGYPSVQSIV